MTREELNTSIDTVFDDNRADNSLSPSIEGTELKKIADYIDQEVGYIVNASKISKTSITSEQILNIYTTPINIVPAPGVGKLIIPSFIIIKVKFNTTTYSDVGGAWKVALGDSGLNITTITNYIGSAMFDKETIQTLFYSGATTSGTFINQPLILTTTGNNPLGGDSGVDVYVIYSEITI